MASLDDLPADQRAVLQLVLQRGRTYDEIGELLKIERAAVRQRAVQALDSLGPQTGPEPKQRAVIADYLLRQLPARASDDARERLAESPAERAWARVVASELSPMASTPLPEIPVESTRRQAAADAERGPVAAAATRPKPQSAGEVARAAGLAESSDAGPTGLADSSDAGATGGPGAPAPRRRRSSRLGGALLLGAGVLVVAVVVVVIATTGGSSKHSRSSSTSASAPATTAASTSSTASTTPQVVHQINLTSPGAPATKTAGLADVLKQGNTDGIAIVAQNVPANTKHDAYAVWLYNTPADSHILGFVNPGVSSNGRLSTAGALPANASHFKRLIVTLETQASPKAPGKIILQGPLTLQ
jgi:Sigma-70, region 4